MRDVLLPDGQHVYDDMLGDLPEYDEQVRKHDDALEELRRAAVACHEQLASYEPLKEFVRAVAASPDRAEAAAKLVYEALVNGWDADLGHEFELREIWNEHAPEFRERVAGLPAMRKLLRARAHFADTVTSVCERLRVIRKDLSREYDVPVANVGGLFEAATD